MSRNYDNWERLVAAVLDREKLRQLARKSSFDSTVSDFSSRFSFDSTYGPGLEEIISFSSVELRKATRNFRTDGAFAYGFRGWIDEHTLTAAKPGSGLAIAVKKIKSKEFQGHKEWLTEVNYLGQLRHPNLVKLIGYCSEGKNRLLVYEFMPRGSLEMHLFERRLYQTLSWETRLNVAIGVARGLSFLHDRETPHRDVRDSTILLDWDFNAKLDGFTLDEPYDPAAAVAARGDTVHPNALCNRHPAAPEYIFEGLLTEKSNVYSFGVVLLQLLCGRRTFEPATVHRERNLVHWAKPCLSDRKKLSGIMDPKLKGQYHQKDAYAVAVLAGECLSFEPDFRPSMTKVLAALEDLKLSSKS